MNTLIINPRAHRETWARANPQSMIEHGGILSPEDLARWACDVCMAPLDPGKPIMVVGGSEGMSVCEKCAPQFEDAIAPCQCEGCRR